MINLEYKGTDKNWIYVRQLETLLYREKLQLRERLGDMAYKLARKRDDEDLPF